MSTNEVGAVINSFELPVGDLLDDSYGAASYQRVPCGQPKQFVGFSDDVRPTQIPAHSTNSLLSQTKSHSVCSATSSKALPQTVDGKKIIASASAVRPKKDDVGTQLVEQQGSVISLLGSIHDVLQNILGVARERLEVDRERLALERASSHGGSLC